ncbi:MAG: chromate transporter [Firmicutes bacterium HGW-Firmicutes-3]|nr:MAG: chromate transporter [Firmicutes bacterium HGW-Firmicutes-3]
MHMTKYLEKQPISRKNFLQDVLICSLGAYGGPEAHMGVFIDQMVIKKNYLSEEELIELIALCSILPGPTSTQTIVSIGYKTGGPVLALLTMLVWALPVLMLMTLLSFLYQFFEHMNLDKNNLRYIGPMAVGFIVMAAFRINKKVVTNKLTFVMFLFGAIVTYFIREPWVFPLVLIIGGIVSILGSKEKDLWQRVKVNPPWVYIFIFSGIGVLSIILTLTWDNILIHLFESFYRYGYLVFGGGQVVVPVMHSELVQVNQYMTNQEFLTGYGLVQGLPGPMFSFSAYAGGMAARSGGPIIQTLGAIAGGVGIFLPGLLLIYFVYPVWENLKKIKGIKVSLKGINAVAGGMIGVAAIILMQQSGLSLENIIITVMTVLMLITKRIPAPIMVLAVIVAGFLIG